MTTPTPAEIRRLQTATRRYHEASDRAADLEKRARLAKHAELKAFKQEDDLVRALADKYGLMPGDVFRLADQARRAAAAADKGGKS